MLGSARRWRLLALGLGLAFVVAACGSKSNGSGSGSTATTKASAVDQALAAKVPAAIKSDGKLLIGTDSSYAPSEFLDTDGKTVIGFDVDLFNAVAAKLGLTTQWVSAPFDAIIPGVQSGKYEVGVSSFTINSERKQQVNMVSYFSAGTQWGAKKGNPTGIQPDNACGKKVAVQTSTVQDRWEAGHHHRPLPAAGPGDRLRGLWQGRRDARRLPGGRLRGEADQWPARAAR